LILHRLYDRGVATRDQVINRYETVRDVAEAQVADARATVERRRSDVIRAQQVFRAASDQLKSLINSAETPVGGEELLVPVDDAVDAPIAFSLADILTTAVRSRPEMHQAILSIDNTSIRQQVADNARLPRLDLRLQTRFAGLQNDVGEAYNDMLDGAFIDYLVGIQFELPLGNRQAEAQYRQRRLERQQATIAYRNTVQQIVLQAKQALRLVVTNYRLIEQTRIARLAESENLRAFAVETRVRGRTIEQLDLLAQAEQAEVGALTDYNTAVAQLYSAMGTILEHNQIEFKVPDADDPLEAGGVNSPVSPVVPVGEPTPVQAPFEPRPALPWGRGR
jgi:outer membrane protein TolC